MTQTPRPYHFCSACGSAYDSAQLGKHALLCARCGHTHYRNPAPVANLLVPHDNGLIMIRRGIKPGMGKMALPGGFMNIGETWQEAAAREVFEETQVVVPRPNDTIDFFLSESVHEDAVTLLFGIVRHGVKVAVREFAPSEEVLERHVYRRSDFLKNGKNIAFPAHTRALMKFFG